MEQPATFLLEIDKRNKNQRHLYEIVSVKGAVILPSIFPSFYSIGMFRIRMYSIMQLTLYVQLLIPCRQEKKNYHLKNYVIVE